jgi:molybdenum cofactor guanylyltransferase
MENTCSGIILAGGLNTRHGGRNKALMNIGGHRIIDRLYELMRPLFKDLILVTNDSGGYLDLDLRIVTDIFGERSSLTGMHAGLTFARCTHAFLIACDTPFAKKEMIELLLSETKPEIDVVIPETRNGREPLFAVYSRKCLPHIEKSLKQRNFKIQHFFNDVRVHFIGEDKLRSRDPDLVSFFNVNSPDRIGEAERMAAAIQAA